MIFQVIPDGDKMACRPTDQQKYCEWNKISNRIGDFRNEERQRVNQYDASDYYRQNPARRNCEKTWRASVAY